MATLPEAWCGGAGWPGVSLCFSRLNHTVTSEWFSNGYTTRSLMLLGLIGLVSVSAFPVKSYSDKSGSPMATLSEA